MILSQGRTKPAVEVVDAPDGAAVKVGDMFFSYDNAVRHVDGATWESSLVTSNIACMRDGQGRTWMHITPNTTFESVMNLFDAIGRPCLHGLCTRCAFATHNSQPLEQPPFPGPTWRQRSPPSTQ